jgi:hypothetical protein
MSVIPQTPRVPPPWAPYQGSALDPLGTFSGSQIPRLLTPPLTTNPRSAPVYNVYLPVYDLYLLIHTDLMDVMKLSDEIIHYS